MKVWPDMWPDGKPLYQTKKWFYIETKTVHDSTQAFISFVWPEDTARADVHEFEPDTTNGDFDFEPSGMKPFKLLLPELYR